MKLSAIALVTLLLMLAPASWAKPKHRSHKNAATLRKNLHELHAKKQELQHQLHTNKVQTNLVVEDIQEVDFRLDKLENQLEETTDQLSDSRDEQQRLATELIEANKDLELTKDKVRRRLRQMYMAGQGSEVSVLMGSTTAGDLASREFLSQRIASSDKRLFDRYKQLKSATEARKLRQDAVVLRINGLARRERSQKVVLAGTREEKSQKLQSLRQRQDQLKKMIAQFDQDESEIAGEIAAFSRRTRGGQDLHLGKFSGHFSRPVNARVTSTFGMRYHPILHIVRMHTGIDFGTPVGTPIHAAGDGVVILAQHKGGYGNTIVVEHGGGMQTLYGHCSAIIVGSGQRVKRGQVIGRSGNSGLSTGPHLHFEVRINGRPVNPLRYL